jgi:hypothetical protein
MERVEERAYWLRHFINYELNLYLLRTRGTREKRDWAILCAFLDVLEDTAAALQEYEARGLGEGWGERCLRLYGVLNAIYLQQGALVEVYRILGLPLDKDGAPGSAYADLRIVRSDVASHAIARQYCAFLARIKFTKAELEIVRQDKATGAITTHEFELRQLYDRYKEELLALLDIEEPLRQYAAKHGLPTS